MNSVVCTLFENEYHHGLAALTNSLYKKGFRNTVYAGYRGAIPDWANPLEDIEVSGWNKAKIFKPLENLNLIFLELDTSYHLTNYKPDFMLRLWDIPELEVDLLFYFDPDIVLTAPWSFIEVWAQQGIAVCEDLKSPIEKYHPRRVGWRKYYSDYNISLNFKNSKYVNGGFIGISKDRKDFLNLWKTLQEYMAEHIGGLEKSSITKGKELDSEFSFDFSCFGATDQDALNATIEACDYNVSFMGKEAMALQNGSPVLMPHALGQPKPWAYKPFQRFLSGDIPRLVDKEFWISVSYPIQVYSPNTVKIMNWSLKFYSFLSRFYSK